MKNNITFKQSKRSSSKLKINRPKLNRDNTKPVFTFCDFIKNTNFYTKEDNAHDKHSLYNFLNSIQDFCSHTWGEIKQKPQMFHCHEIEEDKKLPLPPNFNEIPLIQFKLPNHQEGRFIGFFDEKDVFHIVLYDRKHQVYKRK